MRLQNVLALTRANLINKPFVSLFNNLVIDVNSVKRGDLFLAFNKDDIKDAVKNGAYGIIFDQKNIDIIDNEIAWIEVEDVANALKRLLRFILLEKKVTAYETDEVTLHLAKKIVLSNNLVVLDGSNEDILKKVLNIENSSAIIFNKNLTDRDLFTQIKNIDTTKEELIQIKDSTIFETTFIYENNLYEKELISEIFIPNLKNLIALFKKLDVEFRLNKISTPSHFEPQFVNEFLEKRDFGSTHRVLIFESSIDVIKKEIEFLKKKAPWAKQLYILPEYIEDKFENSFKYKDEKDIVTFLKKSNFNFALIVNAQKDKIIKETKKQVQLTLDF